MKVLLATLFLLASHDGGGRCAPYDVIKQKLLEKYGEQALIQLVPKDKPDTIFEVYLSKSSWTIIEIKMHDSGTRLGCLVNAGDHWVIPPRYKGREG